MAGIQKIGKDNPKFINRIGENHTTNEGYKVEIVEYINKRNCSVKIGDIVISEVEYVNIKKGKIKNPYHKSVYDVGYFGVGVYNTIIHKKQYRIWKHILGRCYNEIEQEKTPTYKGCSVAEEWYNFQVFAEWFEENYYPEYMEGWHLDKDILIKGNKIYSPETCCFVPHEINILFKKKSSKRVALPIGVSKLKNGKFYARVNKLGVTLFLGYFDTPEEAFQAYKIEKEVEIKRVADKWKSLILTRTYEAIYNYKIEITD